MLTLFYASATFLQSWRIKNVCQKIAEQLSQQASISFYALPVSTDDGYDAALATSELCNASSRRAAKVSQILWLHGQQRGCCLHPMQTLHIAPWISFPEAPSWLPFAYSEGKFVEESLVAANKKEQQLHLLLEAEIQPDENSIGGDSDDIVRIEDYGKLIAWKIDSHLAVLIATDIEHFTKLLISTFLQSNFLINDQLPLIRIESIRHEGVPQPFELVASHQRKSTRTALNIGVGEWQKHLDGLRSLSVLANQATEFEYNKNRTEGKTGVVKPDLIPHEKLPVSSGDAVTEAVVVPSSPTKSGASSTAVTASVASSPAKGAAFIPTPKSPSKKETASQMTEKTVKLIATESRQTDLPTIATNLTKMLTKPSEIKSQETTTAVSDGRFKTTKVAESPRKIAPPQPSTSPTVSPQIKVVSSPAKNVSKSNELDKSAAVALPKKSPLHTSATSPTTSSSTTKAFGSLSTPFSSTAPPPPLSVSKDNAKRPSLRRNKDSLRESKPLNVLVYSDTASARESTVATLKDILEKDMYTIYQLTPSQVEQKYWLENTALLVVCGTVAPNIGEIFVDYFLHGGKVLSICSDILHFILPTYRTAEVREHELVQFSYDKWQKVKMMHHIFCYQPSPVKKNFSTESEDSTAQAQSTNARKSALVCPRSIELKDLNGELHNLDVKVLGTEETWNTPSLLLAFNIKSGGKALFSQVHLETNPSQFEADEMKFNILKQYEKIRLEIFAHLLSKHLNANVEELTKPITGSKYIYQNAYFLGRHESKFELLAKLKENGATDNVIATSKLTIKFCGKDEKPPIANANILPILTHSCPDDFSTVEYFDTLKTNYIGRLVIYAPVVTSSMNVIDELQLTHGIVVLPRQQTDGVGRSKNQWLSPLGCAMFSIQLHISMDSPLGSRLPLIQHIIGLSMVNTLKSHDNYKDLNIGLKWPNDIYANGINKIGGLIVKTTLLGTTAIVNIGCGINLDNSKPTVCINDLIRDFNRANQRNLPPLQYEKCIALMFNEIERLVEQVQTGDFEYFYRLYYELWLHSDQTIVICDKDGKQKNAEVVGIDEYGFLQVKMSTGAIENVQPDGNSFDMLKGLIVPKFN